MIKLLRACPECRNWFVLSDFVGDATNAFRCDYHTDFTQRSKQAARLQSEAALQSTPYWLQYKGIA